MTNKEQRTKNKEQKKLLSVICYLLSENSGQIVLMLVLITIVGLTIALSLISRTVTDIRISSQIEQSGRAFSAAEAGIENALKSSTVNGSSGNVTFPDATGSYSVSEVGGTSAITLPVTAPNTSQTIWLANHDSDGTLNETSGNNYLTNFSFDLCWGTDQNITPAMVVTLFYRVGASSPYTYKVARGSYDKEPSSHGNNGFDSASIETGGTGYCDGNYRFRRTIAPNADLGVDPASVKLLFLRIRPAYENSIFAVKPNGGISLPIQSKLITSVGQTDTGVVRKIQVSQGNNELPSIFDFSLFVEN